ncbi:MAG: CHAT domain-containing protein [Xenococcaceae cyanobacterium]
MKWFLWGFILATSLLSAPVYAQRQPLADLEKALFIYREQREQPELLPTLLELGQRRIELGQGQRAMPLLEEAAALAQKLGDKPSELVAWGLLGNAYTLTGAHDEAIDAYTNSRNLAIELNDEMLLKAAANGLANVYRLKAERAALNAELASAELDFEAQQQFRQQAQVNRSQQLRYLREAIATRGTDLESARAILNAVSRGILPKKELELARAILEQLPPSQEQIYLTLRLGQFDSHRKVLLESVKAARTLGDSRLVSSALLALALEYERQENYSWALVTAREGLLMAQQVRDVSYQLQWLIGRIYRQLGQMESAKEAYRTALSTLQLIRRDLIVASKELRFDFRDRVELIYRELLELLLASGQPSDVKETLVVFDLLKLAQLENYFKDECIQAEIELPDEVLSRTNAALITIIALPQSSYVVLKLPKQEPRAYPVGIPGARLEQLAFEWRSLLEDYRNNRYRDVSLELYQLLIKPLEPELTAAQPSTLIFNLDGAIANVPMAALWDGEQYLIEKYPLAVTLGLSFLQSSKKTKLNLISFGLTEAKGKFTESLSFVDDGYQLKAGHFDQKGAKLGGSLSSRQCAAN